MVSEKDAALKRVEARKEFKRQEQKKLDAATLGYRWYVNEHAPAYTTYDDLRFYAKDRKVSEYFSTEKAAQDWLAAHVADEGNFLQLKRERLIQVTSTQWLPY